MNFKSPSKIAAAVALSALVSGCASIASGPISPREGSPVMTNHTPYSRCLNALSQLPGANLPTISVGQILDQTGQVSYSTITNSATLTQGVSEMLISALFKTRKVKLAERLDIRIPLAERQLQDAGAMQIATTPLNVQPVDFVILGALTELNYNILTQGARLYVGLVGGGTREAVINVGLDPRFIE
ncbi:CsgG/HfaB family protein [Vreelandella stevensii]|uniref:CsgG/HfaB family protein n=1 Tax=Vreelandella stevensii TaxID=502821 RepID=UPI00403A9895